MSAVDRMAVRTPDGKIRSVARRVGLGMIARNQAKPAPHQRVQHAGALGNRPASAVTVVTAQNPELAPPVEARGPAADTVVVDEPAPAVEPTVSSVIDREVLVERPKGNAGRDAWATYARAHGMTITDEMSRNYIRDTVVSMLETDRMSQPAPTDDTVEGGRLATPEDEPVTEDMVTSADPGERTA